MTTNKLTDLRKALRFEYMSFTLALPLLGAVSVPVSITLPQVIGLLAVGFFFHAHSAFVNDLIDLPIDRTNPARAGHPMARGSLNRLRGSWLALAALALAMATAAIQRTTAPGYATLITAFAFMTVYNVWGKKLSAPPLMDATLCAAFAALVLFGAVSTGGIGPVTWLVCFFAMLFMMLANACGGLRGLANDLRHGANTTAIFFGARPLKSGLHIPRSLIRYVGLLNAVFYAVAGFALLAGWFEYPLITTGVLLAIVAVCATATSVALAALPAVAARDARAMMSHAHLVLCATAGVALTTVAPRVSPLLAVGVALLFLSSFACWRPARLYLYWRERLR